MRVDRQKLREKLRFFLCVKHTCARFRQDTAWCMLPRCLAVSSSSAFTLDSVRSFGRNESRRQRTPRTQRGLGRALGHDQGASGAHGAHGPQLSPRWSQPSSPMRMAEFHPVRVCWPGTCRTCRTWPEEGQTISIVGYHWVMRMPSVSYVWV